MFGTQDTMLHLYVLVCLRVFIDYSLYGPWHVYLGKRKKKAAAATTIKRASWPHQCIIQLNDSEI